MYLIFPSWFMATLFLPAKPKMVPFASMLPFFPDYFCQEKGVLGLM